MSTTLSQLVADYTARGWTFEEDPDCPGFYAVTSPALRAISKRDFGLSEDAALFGPPEALKNATKREILEDFLLGSEAAERADHLYGHQIYTACSALATKQMKQLALLLRKGIDPLTVPGLSPIRVSIEIDLANDAQS